ncbi:hypothetical protein ACP4OV_013799 [Aristida adscensionis]
MMEVMWGLKNLMKSLVPREKSDLTKEDLQMMSRGMKKVLDTRDAVDQGEAILCMFGYFYEADVHDGDDE